MEININRNVKDSLFKIIFGENKENALSLYNAINNTHYTNADDLEIVTIKNAVYISKENDVSFLFDDALNLYEHQSTCNPNMPLRGLEYFSVLYSSYIDRTQNGRKMLYGTRAVNIPTPHFIVFYNGMKEMPDRLDLQLSDLYNGKGDIDIAAHVININYGSNRKLFESCKPLSDLSEFVQEVRVNRTKGYSNIDAVRLAVDTCRKKGIMTEILDTEEDKVISSLLTALTEEEIEELHEIELKQSKEDAIKEGRAEGIEQGRAEGLEQGIEQKDALLKLMVKDNRLEEYIRSADDKELYQSLLKEYGLLDK